jgi:hypothetical protein
MHGVAFALCCSGLVQCGTRNMDGVGENAGIVRGVDISQKAAPHRETRELREIRGWWDLLGEEGYPNTETLWVNVFQHVEYPGAQK